MTTTPIDWPGFYRQINQAAPIPVQTIEDYSTVATVANTLVVLDDVLAKCSAQTEPPTLLTVYADVIKINGRLDVSIDHGGLFLCARRIELASGAALVLKINGQPTGKLAIFCHESGGVLTVAVNGKDTFDLSDRTLFGSLVTGIAGAPVLKQLPDFQDSGLAYGDPLRINATSILQFALAAFYLFPEIARSMFSYVLRVTNGSEEAKDLHMQASAALGNLLVNASPVTYVPYLDKDVYEQSMAGFVAAASAYETQYQRFADQSTSAQDRLAAAKLMVAHNQDLMDMNQQLILQADKNLVAAKDAAIDAQFAVQKAQSETQMAGIAFEYDSKIWVRGATIDAVMGICVALIQFGGSIAAMCVGDDAGAATAASAVGNGAKAAEAAAKAGEKAGDQAKAVIDLSASMKKIAEVSENLSKMYDALMKIIELSKNIHTAENLPDATLPQVGNLEADPGWDVFMLNTTALLRPAIDLKVTGAQEYLDAVQKLALYSKAYMAAQVSVVTVAQQLVRLQLQQQVNAAQVTRLNDFTADIDTSRRNFDEMKQVFFEWELNMRFWVFTVFQQYAWAYRYWALRTSGVTPSIVKTVAQLQQDLAKVKQEYADALASFTPPPQSMHKGLTISAADTGMWTGLVQALQTAGTTTLPIGLSNPGFAGLDRVRLSTVRVWLVGVQASESVPVNLKLSTSGFYEDRMRGQNFQFSTQPLTYAFNYQGDVGDVQNITVDGAVDARERYLYFQPTPFTQWTISVTKDGSPALDLSKLTAIRLEFLGSVNASQNAVRTPQAVPA